MRQIITIICVTLCAKRFLDLNFDLAVIDKIFPNFTYSQNRNLLSIIETF